MVKATAKDRDMNRHYNAGFADSNQDISMTVRPILETVLARYGADMTPELKEQIMAALRELWPFEDANQQELSK